MVGNTPGELREHGGQDQRWANLDDLGLPLARLKFYQVLVGKIDVGLMIAFPVNRLEVGSVR